ncbi:hypothetical protein [Chitinophaga pinensis]|uniref:Uncharacterized protein n=1 Tax=Chitinophaga pinensis (strain ATCC 43595 / DSM 2588 / LMG 13176 / NBRC 15968 / NCIMB 11800 / UQM 2034) TaxID=485918 RepID=A0A979GQ03_CHIPD|nr:hypothetical protein [Chitinophaga pinensis]ACU60967.1 hypothetical protein Cpin_3503 [Chitinophaga pinensis DSM 2588]
MIQSYPFNHLNKNLILEGNNSEGKSSYFKRLVELHELYFLYRDVQKGFPNIINAPHHGSSWIKTDNVLEDDWFNLDIEHIVPFQTKGSYSSSTAIAVLDTPTKLADINVFSDNVTYYLSRLTERSRKNLLSLIDSFVEVSAFKNRKKILKEASIRDFQHESGIISSKPSRVEKWRYEVAFHTDDFKISLLSEYANYQNYWEHNGAPPDGISASLIAFCQFINKRVSQTKYRIKAYYRKIILNGFRDIKFHLRSIVRILHITPDDGKEDKIGKSLNIQYKNLLTNQIFFISWIRKKLNNC